jgi:hypothetical protein
LTMSIVEENRTDPVAVGERMVKALTQMFAGFNAITRFKIAEKMRDGADALEHREIARVD